MLVLIQNISNILCTYISLLSSAPLAEQLNIATKFVTIRRDRKPDVFSFLAGRSGPETFFFLDHLLLVGKFAISARKSLRISAKTFAPLILILPPDLAKLATPLRLRAP